MTDFLEQPTVEKVFMFKCDPDSSNPGCPRGSARDSVLRVFEKNRINRVITGVTPQIHPPCNDVDNRVLFVENVGCKKRSIRQISRKNVATLVASANPKFKESRCQGIHGLRGNIRGPRCRNHRK